MGGDKGPKVVVRGVLESLKRADNRFLLVGDSREMEPELRKADSSVRGKIEVLHADDTITMDDSPVEAVREKRQSSLVVAARAVREGKAQALVSTGNTGAVLAAGSILLGRIKGVERPAIGTVIPSSTGHSVLIDVGANVDSRATHLLHFGVMGAIYAKTILNISEPRVGVLSIGEERKKGNELSREAVHLFDEFFETKGLPENLGKFLGNVEGRDIVNGRADVIVCDGFVGNALLKFGEGLVSTVGSLMKEEIMASPMRKAGALLIKGAFDAVKKRVDYAEYGGAPLLGVKSTCIICHGSSDEKAIMNAVRVARESVDADICGRIGEVVSIFDRRRATENSAESK